MVQFAILLICLFANFKSHALAGKWDFSYQNSYCSMTLVDSFYTDDKALFSYAVIFKFISKSHPNADELLTNNPILEIEPYLLTKNHKRLGAKNLFVNGAQLNAALSNNNFYGIDVMVFLRTLLSSEAVIGVAEFSNGTEIPWTFNTNELQINSEFYKVCVEKST
ncbi:hypothetical protein [Pseudoalteromonas aurantia]|uniref:Uncharacterized protein n=1 Tax=Pseudoalteromonas aurantia 208 TaxID=1314867 RepID=A0ABR9EAZ5_9GAMM|nr:hypothetical protein [Pseudoalteromonas aurantia]MBE0368139.1 hypothetical protein [Pseudoalteromonas aurantia 208]